MHIERMHKMIECLTEKALAELESGVEHIDTCEFGAVVDMIKDLNEAEYRAVIVKSMKEADEEEKEYDKELLRALKEEYGEEGGRRCYDNYHYKTSGRFAPRGKGIYRKGYEEPPYLHMMPEYEMSVSGYKSHSPEYWRDVDRVNGRLYFSEPIKGAANMSEHERIGTGDMRNAESRYEKAKRMYTETKDMHKGNTPEDKAITLKEGEKMLNVIFDELTEITKDASPEMRSMVKTKGMSYLQKIQ